MRIQLEQLQRAPDRLPFRPPAGLVQPPRLHPRHDRLGRKPLAPFLKFPYEVDENGGGSFLLIDELRDGQPTDSGVVAEDEEARRIARRPIHAQRSIVDGRDTGSCIAATASPDHEFRE